MKTVTDETEGVCMQGEHCRAVVPIPFELNGFLFCNLVQYYSPAPSRQLNAFLTCAIRCPFSGNLLLNDAFIQPPTFALGSPGIVLCQETEFSPMDL